MISPGVPLVCSLGLLAGASALVAKCVRATAARPLAPAMRFVLVGLAAIYLVGISWGIPWGGWAPDEIPPWFFLDAIDQRLVSGWHDKYPPMLFYLNAVLYLPFVVLARTGWLDLSTNATQAVLLLVSRALSTVMAIGAVCGIYVVSDELYGAPGAVFAAAIAGVTLPFVFYAKLANVDVPYLFWFAWSMVFYARFVANGRRADALWFALTAATAVETKDQAYGFYLLPMVHVAFISRKALSIAIAGGVGAFLLESNLLFNFSGFMEHLRAAVNVGVDLNRLSPSMIERQITVARLTVINLVWSMTWLGALAAAAGIVNELRQRRFLWLLLPLISYHVFFLSTITSVFDRYLLGDYMILAIFAGGWIATWLRAPAPHRQRRLLVCAAGTAALAWYGASIDLMMLGDSRYAAERWLRARTPPTSRVALLGPRAYLPGVETARITRILASPAATPTANLPDFVVANVQVMRRTDLAAVDRDWWTWLSSGDSPYRIAARFDTRPRASLLTYTTAFRNDVEDAYTNLDKVAPPIVIYWRISAGR